VHNITQVPNMLLKHYISKAVDLQVLACGIDFA